MIKLLRFNWDLVLNQKEMAQVLTVYTPSYLKNVLHGISICFDELRVTAYRKNNRQWHASEFCVIFDNKFSLFFPSMIQSTGKSIFNNAKIVGK